MSEISVATPAVPGRWRQFRASRMGRALSEPLTLLGVCLVAIHLFLALFAQFISPYPVSALIGAPLSSARRGAAHIFERLNGSWTHRQQGPRNSVWGSHLNARYLCLRTSPVITSVAEVVRLQSELSRVRRPQELISGPFLTGQRHVRLPYKPEAQASEHLATHSLAGASGLYSQ